MSVPARFKLCDGVRVAGLGEGWVAFSPQSGETLLLNAESAAVLELLADGPADAQQVAVALAVDAAVAVAEVADALRHTWGPLRDAGLVELADAPAHNVR